MRIGLLIGLLLKYIIALSPAVLVLFSKKVSGKTKAKWFLSILILPYLLKEIVFAIIYFTQRDILVIYGPIVLGGWAPAIPLTWYISAWAMYIYFRRKYKHSRDIADGDQLEEN